MPSCSCIRCSHFFQCRPVNVSVAVTSSNAVLLMYPLQSRLPCRPAITWSMLILWTQCCWDVRHHRGQKHDIKGRLQRRRRRRRPLRGAWLADDRSCCSRQTARGRTTRAQTRSYPYVVPLGPHAARRQMAEDTKVTNHCSGCYRRGPKGDNRPMGARDFREHANIAGACGSTYLPYVSKYLVLMLIILVRYLDNGNGCRGQRIPGGA